MSDQINMYISVAFNTPEKKIRLIHVFKEI